MDQKKIGAFIAKVRKNKKMTQQELADKLSVTDRAVSNWENGRRMPDVSFFKPLCEILEISVNELICGEIISEDRAIASSNEIIISTLNINEQNRKKSNKIIKILFIILLFLVVIIFMITSYYNDVYPKIDIYSLIGFSSDDDFKLKKQFTYKLDNKKYDVYYYGVDSVQLCNSKSDCYNLKTALDYNQVNMQEVKVFLESQYALGNVEKFLMYDGGTTIYENDRYSVIYCNTMEGNRDIYFGKRGMIGNLNGFYCGKEKYTEKRFIRTYHIISSAEDSIDDDFMNVTLRDYQGEIATVSINKSNNIIVGRDYEFSFYAFDIYEDTIENIFLYSTFLEAKETDKRGVEQINDPIYVNEV